MSDPNGHKWFENAIDYFKTPEERDARYRGLIQVYLGALDTIDNLRNDTDNPMNDRDYENNIAANLAAKARYEDLIGATEEEWQDRAFGAAVASGVLTKLPRTAGPLGFDRGKRLEDIARNRYDVGQSMPYRVNGRNRIADGINPNAGTITEVKNLPIKVIPSN